MAYERVVVGIVADSVFRRDLRIGCTARFQLLPFAHEPELSVRGRHGKPCNDEGSQIGAGESSDHVFFPPGTKRRSGRSSVPLDQPDLPTAEHDSISAPQLT